MAGDGAPGAVDDPFARHGSEQSRRSRRFPQDDRVPGRLHPPCGCGVVICDLGRPTRWRRWNARMLTLVDGGWSIQLTVSHLPDLGPGRFYECWYADSDSRPGHPDLITAGTFTTGRSGTATVQMWCTAEPPQLLHHANHRRGRRRRRPARPRHSHRHRHHLAMGWHSDHMCRIACGTGHRSFGRAPRSGE